MKTKLLIFAMAIGLMACENQENVFEDFGSTAVYFPYQTPARSLVLGEYDLGFNDNDNDHKFEIGVIMSGVYTNKQDRKVYFELAPDLIDPVALGVTSTNVKVLPSAYYTIEQESPVTIPAGSTKGRIPVQLNDAFFEDPLSFAGDDEVNYVIPLKITDKQELDTILSGLALEDVLAPMRVRNDDWQIVPKDYTLFGIKFMNKYQGVYLRRGADEKTDGAGVTVSTVYRDEFVVRDELVPVTTSGRHSVELSNIVRRAGEASPGSVNIDLSFNDEGVCTISSFGDDAYNVSGTGEFVQDGDEWGGEKRDVIYLDYQYTDAVNAETHAVKDTLVLRNRDVKFEEFTLEFTE
ncbi:DUF5627 domain-containing protein [Flavicella sediminum]|uniref:DUF5627 domain-containing protein n=1 Tax=Flavicella sediminum TaxID=2585141 RepID=UPI00140E3B38|nr:DUF5627 domain-containing protein [Flavicella sediminum]